MFSAHLRGVTRTLEQRLIYRISWGDTVKLKTGDLCTQLVPIVAQLVRKSWPRRRVRVPEFDDGDVATQLCIWDMFGRPEVNWEEHIWLLLYTS